MASSEEPFLLVAAIDFGTTFSGYAFSFTSSDMEPKRHEKIRMNKNWGASMGFQSHKTSTSVLTTKHGKFLAFGYEAEQNYTQALEETENDSGDEAETKKPDMLLFRHFKMMLHKPKKAVNLDCTIAAVDGTIRKAVDIFAHALRYLKNHMLNAIKLEIGCFPRDNEIRWVITVPAIWGEASKKFMREAAHVAGCIKDKSSKNLMIALEPEAASMCCRSLSLAQYDDATDVGFPMGTKYLVVDCGGGTVDITAHEVEFDKKIKELVEASGGPWGGTAVEKKFRDFLEETLGKHFLNVYIKRCPNEWLQFLTNFERSKKAFTSDPTSKINVGIPLEMANLYAGLNNGKSMVKTLKEREGVKSPSGMMSIQHDLAQSFFDDVISCIIKHLQDLLKESDLSKVNYILMVGGFSECSILQDALKSTFERNGTKILIPGEAQMAIIKGAVLYGHNPQDISERMLRYTYGCSAASLFDEKCHDSSKRFTDVDGVTRCNDVFKVLAVKGTLVKRNDLKKKTFGSFKKRKEMQFRLYAYDGIVGNEIHYTDEPKFNRIGTIRVTYDNKEKDKGDRFELCFLFGHAEILAEVTNLTSGKKESVALDLL